MFAPGVTSRERLAECDLELGRTIRFAYTVSVVDFTVFETLRSQARVDALVAAGLSRSPNSHHLPGPDGKANAADLVPWIAGQPRWLAAAGYHVAEAMHAGQRHAKADITWGGVWDRKLAQLDVTDLHREVELYTARWLASHPRPPGHVGYWGPLIDLWHFEVPRG
jgi:peptidoglycan LD-endopeptidase CwlK